MWHEERDGKHRYFERYTDPRSGKLRRVSVTLDRKADKKAISLLQAKIKDASRESTSFTLKETADAYLKEHKQTVRASTYVRNERSINYTVDLLGRSNLIDRLTAGYIRDRYSSSGKPARTCNENMSRFKTFIRWAYRHDYVSSTACIDKLERFKDTPIRERIQDKFLNSVELSTLLDCMADEGNRLVTEFLALSGLRIGELIALDDSDVTDVIHVTKTFSPTVQEITPGKTLAAVRDVHIQPELANCVKRLRSFMRKRKLCAGVPKCTYFVVSRTGNRLEYYAYNKYLKENTEKIIGRALTAHSLRHTHASLLMEAGYPLEAISRRLGHESSDITKQIYLHITEGIKKKDADMLDIITLLPPICPQKQASGSEKPIK